VFRAGFFGRLGRLRDVETQFDRYHRAQACGAALASVNRKLIEAQEQKRARIARELHDDIFSLLPSVVVREPHRGGDAWELA
jgi:signal transduction histidine kinase